MDIKNLKYNQRGTIDCEIEHPNLGWIPFTAAPDDVEEYGPLIYQQALNGELGEIAPYEPPPLPTEGELAAEVQAKRDRLLKESDWSQLPDVPEDTKLLYRPYRQALRDITDQQGFPGDVQWPAPPQAK